MSEKSPFRIFKLILSLSLWLGSNAVHAQTAGLLREVYTQINGVSVDDLINAPNFPDNPAFESVLTDSFETPSGIGDFYGQRVSALLVPPATGNYIFWISSDDGSALYLSTDATPANKQEIASVASWTASREWTKEPNQQSSAIRLVANQKYYIEALQKEHDGGDNLAVRWQLPNGTMEEPIPASRFQVYGLSAPVVTANPSSLTVVEGEPATFTVKVDRVLGLTYQWQRNSVDIPNATESTYTLPRTSLSDSGAKFRVQLKNPQGAATSGEATLTVRTDATPPTLTSVSNLGDLELISITFSEPVEGASATRTLNYQVSGGATVLAARLADPQTVVLTTTPLAAGQSYTVTVNNVRDQATAPNTIAANSQKTFSLTYTPLDISRIFGVAEPLGPSSKRTPLVFSELMYHPQTRADGKNLEFLEIYNSNPWPEDMSGFRISGAISYVFPQGTTLGAKAFLVVAAAPQDFRAFYPAANVQGPYVGKLQNNSGVIHLRNRSNAIILEMNYSGEQPWPVAADGAGHSLVLWRPSYGEDDARAWAASSVIGGSPGAAEPISPNPQRTVVINEFLAHTDDPDLDYIELFNYGSQSVDLTGCILTDNASSNKFTIPTLSIPAKGFVVFDQNQLGFSLSSGGETIYLFSKTRDRVIDALRFEGQENGISTGRVPDGGREFYRLKTKSPGAANSQNRLSDVVINELMISPISGSDNGQFIELYNRTASPINLSGWRLEDGVTFTFPPGASIPANGYVVVAENAARLLTNYPNLNNANTFGNYKGKLSGSGERIVLSMPDSVVSTNSQGNFVTNIIHIAVDDVTYTEGMNGRHWSDGGGSSLELIDPNSNGRLPSNWADSDEQAKSDWVTIEATGVLDNGNGAADSLQVLMLGEGEALVDNVEVIPQGGANLVANSTFESGGTGWFFQGTHEDSSIDPIGGFGGGKALHVRAAARGDTGANRVRTTLATALNGGEIVTIRARVRWLSGHPEILLRLHGNWFEATGNILNSHQLGTPGLANSRRVPNAGPVIQNVTHFPVLPTPSQSVTVTAEVSDPNGVAKLVLYYRVDPATNLITLPMTYNGAGTFSAVIPAQAAGQLVAFYISSADASMGSSVFPLGAPRQEALIRFGDPAQGGDFAAYRLWLTQATIDRWSRRERNSNRPLDGTFVYGSWRPVYNVGALYSGSPWHTPGYNSPVGNNCDYVVIFPEDQPLLGTTDFVLATVGNLDNDDTAQREQAAFWIADQLGIPFNYRRYVHMFVNGIRRGKIYEDSQQPNGHFLKGWFPDDSNGNLYKIEDWFEFDESGDNKLFNVDATLQNFTTTGGAKKTARYRWNWRPRAVDESANDFDPLFKLVDAVNAPSAADYTRLTEDIVDVDEWMRAFAVEHIVGNWDAYGYGRGKNMYGYKPDDGKWNLLMWDIDFVLGLSSDPTDASLFSVNDPVIGRMYSHPPFLRAYYRALKAAVDGPLLAGKIGPMLDAKYSGLLANGVPVSDPAGIKDFVALRRAYIISQLPTATFAITSNGGADVTTANNILALTGTAPVEIISIRINGIDYPVTWTTATNWRLDLPLSPGANLLKIEGYDINGKLVSGATRTITATFTGTIPSPEQALGINEIMYNPVAPDAGFIEIYNRSSNGTYDLSNYRIEGADFVFPAGTISAPGTYLVVVNDPDAFRAAYGSNIPIAGVFNGKLSNSGETLRLVKQGATPEQNVVIDQVTYSGADPWPSAANGQGPSLQLIDPAQDNNRVSNWAVAVAQTNNPAVEQKLVPITQTWKYDQSGVNPPQNWTESSFNDSAWPAGPALLFVETAALPAPKGTALTLGRTTYYFRTKFNFTGDPAQYQLRLSTVVDDGVVIYLNGQELYRIGMDGVPTYSTFANRNVGDAVFEGPFDCPASNLKVGENILSAEAHQNNAGSSDVVFGMTLDAVPLGAGTLPAISTPGRVNVVAKTIPAFPSLRINEVEPENLAGLKDNAGQNDPWIEIHNSGPTAVDLAGYFLSQSYSNLNQWAFPANSVINPGQFLIIWADGAPQQTTASELHTNFRLAAGSGTVVLSRSPADAPAIVDYLNYSNVRPDFSFGSVPDSSTAQRRSLYFATPGAANNPDFGAASITINEWMASNTGSVPDPAGGNGDDWFELYNAGNSPIDLGGFTLTDNLLTPAQARIPAGVIIPAKGFLIVWADEQTSQNSTNRPDVHVNFKLSKSGEAIALFDPNGKKVDSITFGPQTDDLTQGRYPDGSLEIKPLTLPTPGRPNFITGANQPPQLLGLANKSVAEEQPLSFAIAATDPDQPAQSLTFSLGPNTPAGLSINPVSGIVSWTPTEQQGPSSYEITVIVTDNGSPAQSASGKFVIEVDEVNRPPLLQPINDITATAGQTISFTAIATDPDLPANSIVFSLEPGAPQGAIINAQTGAFTWTVPQNLSGSSGSITVRAQDTGFPALFATRTFNVTVVTQQAPVIQSISRPQNGTVSITFTSVAGVRYRVQATSDLGAPDWVTMEEIQATGPTVTYTETASPAAPRFYRILVVNP